MSRSLLSLIVWLTAFLVFEIPSKDLLGVWPWYSLSRTVWMGETWWKPVTVITAAILVVLMGHLEFEWRVRWLVVTASIGALLILSHALRRYFG